MWKFLFYLKIESFNPFSQLVIGRLSFKYLLRFFMIWFLCNFESLISRLITIDKFFWHIFRIESKNCSPHAVKTLKILSAHFWTFLIFIVVWRRICKAPSVPKAGKGDANFNRAVIITHPENYQTTPKKYEKLPGKFIHKNHQPKKL